MQDGGGSRQFLTFPVVAAFIAALTAARVVVLLLTPLDLHGDEAQYWSWSRHLDWGYFSKPPLIAWAIAASTAVFGNDEWAVRLLAPLAHMGGAFALYALARRLYDARAAAWAGLGWALMPGVQLSSAIISTDALLLPLTACALLALWRLIETRSDRWALALGLAFGFGVLAKYAMIYFLVGVLLAALMSKRTRAALLSAQGAIALGVGLVAITPNILWNASHDFHTLSHTAENAALGKSLFHPDQLLSFVIDQFVVLGPLLFGALAFWLLPRAVRARARLSEQDRFLVAFVIPPLAVIAVQALLSRANANWAAAAYPAAMAWLAGRLCTEPGVWLQRASLALHGVIQMLLMAALISLPFADRLGMANSIKRARNWEETAALITAKADADPLLTAIAVDNRLMFYDLTYYWRDAPPAPPLRMWLLEGRAGNSAEQDAALQPRDSGRVLIVLMNPDHAPFVREDFVHAVATGAATVPLGPKKQRALTFLLASAFAPAPRDAAFKARLAKLRGED